MTDGVAGSWRGRGAFAQARRRRNSGGTASVSQTPLALTRKTWPARCIAPASNARTTGRPAGADPGGRLPVGREVDVVAGHGAKALGPDRVQGVGDRAVVEVRGRFGRRQVQVDGDGVALVGPDAVSADAALDGEALLVVDGDGVVELGAGEREAVPGRGGEQLVHSYPAVPVQSEADALRLVPQMLRQVCGHLDRATFVHRASVPGASRSVHSYFGPGFVAPGSRRHRSHGPTGSPRLPREAARSRSFVVSSLLRTVSPSFFCDSSGISRWQV